VRKGESVGANREGSDGEQANRCRLVHGSARKTDSRSGARLQP
jgi:hypothetical protein